MVTQPEDSKATTEASPPPYQEFCPNRRSHRFFPKYRSQRQLGPATSGKWYREDTRHPTIKFIFCPDPSQDWNTQDWTALLLVKCCDVPRLMREGFYWDSSNVVQEDGYINAKANVTSPLFQRQGKNWGCVRHYFLKDLQQPQRWIATIEVYALHFETLCRFDLGQLSQEKIRSGIALSQLGHCIYEYWFDQPQHCFNAIYDDMPMEGQWPWPRRNTKDGLTHEKTVASTSEKP